MQYIHNIQISLYNFNKFIQITETEFIHIFSINKGVVAVLPARLALMFQHLED